MSGIIAIITSNGESASPWKMPCWIFTSAKVFLLTVNSTVQFFMVSMMNFMTLSDILYIFRHSTRIAESSHVRAFRCQSMPWLHFYAWFCCPLGCADQCTVNHLFFLIPCSILSIFHKIVHRLFVSNISPP